MRGAIQQEQNGSLDYASRSRKDKNSYRRSVRAHRVATEQEIRPRCGCLQALYHVCFLYPYLVQMAANITRNPDVWADVSFPSDAVADEIKSYIGKRLTPQPTKVRADVEVTCFGYEGIDAVKNALRTAEARNTADTQVKVKLVSPPLYVLTSTCLEKHLGIATLETAIIDIKKNIEANGGSCTVKMEPKAVTENDDAELQALMEKRARENEEVSGDESMSESDENALESTVR
jgi:translation initiation factor 2 alpha subunit (eIF-2alpha)